MRRTKLLGSGQGSSARRGEEVLRLLPDLVHCHKLPGGLRGLLALCTVFLGGLRAELLPCQLGNGRLPGELALLKIGLGSDDLTALGRAKVAGTVNGCKLAGAALLGKVPAPASALRNPAFLAAIVLIAVRDCAWKPSLAYLAELRRRAQPSWRLLNVRDLAWKSSLANFQRRQLAWKGGKVHGWTSLRPVQRAAGRNRFGNPGAEAEGPAETSRLAFQVTSMRPLPI